MALHDVAFLGLGRMGFRMALRASEQGLRVTAWNRSPEPRAQAAERGLRVADTPKDAARDVDAVALVLKGAESCRDVLEGEDGVLAGLREGAVVVNFTTIGPDAARDLAVLVRQAGGEYLDCPVSGTTVPAEKGTLKALAGGSTALIQRVEPLLFALSDEVYHCGDVGAGSAMKLFVNANLAAQWAALSETLGYAERAGIDRERALEVLEGSAARARIAEVKREKLLAGDWDAQFPVALMVKDLDLALEAGAHAEARLPLTDAARRAFAAAAEEGWADEDFIALAKAYARAPFAPDK